MANMSEQGDTAWLRGDGAAGRSASAEFLRVLSRRPPDNRTWLAECGGRWTTAGPCPDSRVTISHQITNQAVYYDGVVLEPGRAYRVEVWGGVRYLYDDETGVLLSEVATGGERARK